MKRILAGLILFVCIFFLYACNKGKRLPILTNADVYEVMPKTAKCGGVLYSEGDSKVIEKGLCWGESSNPTIANFKSVSGEGQGSFSGMLTGLSPDTYYFVRAYATNKFGTSYGRQVGFQTLPSTPVPDISTQGPFSISTTSFTCGGTISALNSNGLITVGICWNTNPSPTIDNYKTITDFSTLSFTNALTGLNANTTYYIRAYATNNSATVYGNELVLKTYSGTLTDVDGNTYYTINIGTQTWMAENLRVAKYRDGSAIASVSVSQAWISLNSGAYCSYNNDPAQETVYGKLYNWFAVADPKQLAPAGWHVPSDNDWLQLENYLGGNSNAGQQIKALSLWYTTGGTGNQSGFTALPGGGRGNTGAFDGLNYSAAFWSSTPSPSVSSQAVLRNVLFNSTNLYNLTSDNVCGFSVRCIKD